MGFFLQSQLRSKRRNLLDFSLADLLFESQSKVKRLGGTVNLKSKEKMT